MASTNRTASTSHLSNRPSWHALDVASVAEHLQASESGLSIADARVRLEEYGPNVIEEEQPQSVIRLFLDQFRSPLIYILLVAAIATIFVEEYIDTAVIVAVLLLNAAIGFVQERKAEQSVMALRKLVAPKAHVLRDGREIDIESRDLVPGDVVSLESGTRVPADIRIIAATALLADESLLTGESAPVQKRSNEVPETTGVADRSNMIYAGTTVASGRGRGFVVETGDQTELGGIAAQVRTHEVTQTPLQDRMDRFAKIIGAAVLGSTALAFVLGIATGISASDMFLVGVGLAVAAIPEGLPIVFTVTLAIGVRRMAQYNAIVRRLPAVETLGSSTIIGSDKTGTLTENRMTVQQLWTPSHTLDLSRETHDADSCTADSFARDALLSAILTNEATIYGAGEDLQAYGDPTEVALLNVAARLGIDPTSTKTQFPAIAETPFEPDLQYSASAREMNGTARLFVKGAPERILEMSTGMIGEKGYEPVDRNQIEKAASYMASRGLRVLATAHSDIDSHNLVNGELPEPHDLTLTGLFGLVDPPREGVKEAIEGCQSAGIRVIMITGDHANTASAIAADLGIANQGAPVLRGIDIDGLTAEALEQAVERVSVFARVSPEHKLLIAEACQRVGHVVAVTGDGVNDAPALKAADIGIAMGRSGTDVAREASDMVLTDDNFVSIYRAVEQGRVTFDNLRKITFFLISTGISATLTILTALVLQWPLPFLPAQLLWLNLVTNGLQDVALAFEPGEPDVLERKPRQRDEGIISRLLWERSLLTGIVMSLGTLVMFSWELNRSDSLVQAQTVALTTMVIFQMFHVGNARSDYRSAFTVSLFSNPILLIATGSAFLVHLGAMHFGPAQFVLRIEPISFTAWGYIILTALTVIAAVEIHKLLRPRRI